MKKSTWSNLFGTMLAGATVATVAAAGKHFAKKYGQNPNPNKLIDLNLANLVDYGLNKYLEQDEGIDIH